MMPPLPVAMPPVELLGARDDREVQRLLGQMRDRFRRAAEAENRFRRAALDDLEFRNGQQWDPVEEQRRIAMGRPCLTVNTIPQYERQILNEQRQQKPSIRVLPVGNGADVKTAKTLQGVVRHIEHSSHAAVAYQTAAEAQVRIGRGYFRLLIDYEDPLSFDRTIRIARIRNPFQVYMDPTAQLPTYADADWGFLTENVDKDTFADAWGISGSMLHMWAAEGDSWVAEHEVRLAEYFYRDKQRLTLARMADGQVGLLEQGLLAGPLNEWRDLNPQPLQRFVAHLLTPRPRYVPLLPWIRQQALTAEAWLDGLPPEFLAWYIPQLREIVGQIVEARPTEICTIRWLKTNGHAILEESIWPGKWIPIIPVLGDELDINNEVMLSGIIRHAKDPMRMENYWLTMQAEHIALSPVPPWLVAVGQVEDHEKLWKTANRVPHAYLPYTPVTDRQGNLVQGPTRNAYEPPVQSITLAMQTTQAYSEASIGMYRGNLGAPSKERSGKALDAKDRQADTGTYHYGDNMARAIEFCGEQVLDLIPHVLTPGKVTRMLADDDTAQMVYVADSARGLPVPADPLEEGIAAVFDLSTGTYDVQVTTGPSYATKRQEAAEQMMQLVQALPEAMSAVVYKIVGTMDWEGAEELGELLKKLPGQILDESHGQNKETQLVQMQQALQQCQQQLEALNAYAQQCEQEKQALEEDNQRLKLDVETKRAGVVQDQAELTAKWQQEQAELLAQRQHEGAKIELEYQKLAWEREKFYATQRQAEAFHEEEHDALVASRREGDEA